MIRGWMGESGFCAVASGRDVILKSQMHPVRDALQDHRQTCPMDDTNLKRARETVAVKNLKSIFNPLLSHSPSRKCLEWLLFSLMLWHVFYSRPPTAFPLSPCSLPPSPS
jgi:hypothetical protein